MFNPIVCGNNPASLNWTAFTINYLLLPDPQTSKNIRPTDVDIKSEHGTQAPCL